MPMKRYSILVLLLVVGAAQAGMLRYQKTDADGETILLWQARPFADGWLIEALDGERRFRNVSREDGSSRSWEVSGKQVELKASLEGDVLLLQGRVSSGRIDKRIVLRNKPWFQALSFSLARFLEQDEQRIEFWTIRPDTFEPVLMIAEKKGHEQLLDRGRSIAVERVRVHPAGLMALLWKADYWFRDSDRRFIRYRSAASIPGLADARIDLLDGQ